MASNNIVTPNRLNRTMQPRDWKTVTAVFSAAVKGIGGIVVFNVAVFDEAVVTRSSSIDVDVDSCHSDNDIMGCDVSSLEIEVDTSINVVEPVVSATDENFADIVLGCEVAGLILIASVIMPCCDVEIVLNELDVLVLKMVVLMEIIAVVAL